MFFSITRDFDDKRFSIQHTAHNFKIHLDCGWQIISVDDTTVFFKGYCDHILLKDLVADFINDPTPQYTGNFCVIIANKNSVTVTHDINRAFPLKFYKKDILTNLPSNDSSQADDIWADNYVSYTTSGELTNNYYDCFYSDNTSYDLSIAECKSGIQNILQEKITGLSQFSSPMHVFLSGGIDTTFVYSLLCNNNNINIKLITDEIFENTEFTARVYQNFRDDPLLWGYGQFHHWRAPTIYATGGMGDEIFMRGPTAAAIICAWYNIDLMSEFKKTDYCYHKKYFLREKNQKVVDYYWQKRKEIQQQYPKYNDVCDEILSIIANDHQHWHLENTITWTPFKDIRILKNILGLPKDDLLKQIMTGFVDKQLIDNFSPGMTQYICNHKNLNQFENLLNFKPFVEAINARV